MLTKRIKTNITLNGNNIEYKSNRDKDKNLSPKEYLDTIKLYLSNIIKNRKKQKIQLTRQINFTSSEDLKETPIVHTKSDNIKTMMGSEKNDNIEEILKSL